LRSSRRTLESRVGVEDFAVAWFVQFGEGADASAPEVEQQLALASSPFKARSDRSKGLPVAIERQTVAQFLDHWLKSIKANVAPLTH